MVRNLEPTWLPLVYLLEMLMFMWRAVTTVMAWDSMSCQVNLLIALSLTMDSAMTFNS